jgi:anti-sigma B factor antagonist
MTSTTEIHGGGTFVRLDYTATTAGSGTGRLRLALHGDIDLTDCALLDDALDQVTAFPPCPLTVDLTAVTFFGSTGLAFLTQLHRHAAGGGHSVTLADPPPLVRRVLEICGFDRVFAITGEAGARRAAQP